MSNIFRIMKKELDKIFLDKRLIFTTFIMPALIVFLIYSCMGFITKNAQDGAQQKESVVALSGAESDIAVFKPFLEAVEKVRVESTDKLSESEISDKIKSGEIQLYAEILGFSEDGKLSVNSYADTVNTSSSVAYSRFMAALEAYRAAVLQSQGVDTIKYVNNYTELAKGDSISISVISMIVPMMLVIMLFANAMSVSAEGIAGEKERGTLATIMMTPVRRTDIIFAKVFANGIITLLVAVSTFIGMAFSLDSFASGMGISGDVSYAFGDYCILLLMISMIALTAVALFSVASTLAKNVKEASSISMPMYVIGMVAAIISANSDLPKDWYFYLIPVYNCAAVIKSVMMFEVSAVNVLVTVASSVVFFVAVCLGLGRLFRHEKILFAQ